MKKKGTRPSTEDPFPAKDTIFKPREAAKYLAVSVKVLAKWRQVGGGPRYIRISGRCIRYRLSDLNIFLDERLRASTSDRG